MTEDLERRYRLALKALEKEINVAQSQRYDKLTNLVLQACLDAEAYLKRHPTKDDSLEAARRKRKRARELLPKQHRAIAELVRCTREFPSDCGSALAFSGFKGWREGEDLAETFALYLENYISIRRRNASSPDNTGMHKVQSYNLIFPHFLERRPPRLSPATGLMFHLVMIFRNYTAGRDWLGPRMWGEPMPNHGRPHYDVAAEFARVATGEEIPEPTVRMTKFLRDNPGVGWAKWPD